MLIKLSETATEQLEALPLALQTKAKKQLSFLARNIRHPSLHAKKYKGIDDVWQARIDRTWRFYFHIIEPHCVVVSIIEHQ